MVAGPSLQTHPPRVEPAAGPMTSFKEPNYSYTEATLRREVHTDNSHWELMYKAMLAQLMTYVDAAVARALA